MIDDAHIAFRNHTARRLVVLKFQKRERKKKDFEKHFYLISNI